MWYIGHVGGLTPAGGEAVLCYGVSDCILYVFTLFFLSCLFGLACVLRKGSWGLVGSWDVSVFVSHQGNFVGRETVFGDDVGLVFAHGALDLWVGGWVGG